MHLTDIFGLDPLLRSPLITCTILGAVSALLGVFVIFRRQALVGETLSHACYPAIIIGLVLTEIYDLYYLPTWITLLLAITSAMLAIWTIEWLQQRYVLSSDTALSTVLVSSFAFSLLFLSTTQFAFPTVWRELQSLLVGQAATISQQYMNIAVAISTFAMIYISLFRKHLELELFDITFTHVHQLISHVFRWGFILLFIIIMLLGIRFMGVLLMSALFIFPTISARLIVSRFSHLLIAAASIGALCGYGGVVLSHTTALLTEHLGTTTVWLPTGPLIILLLSAIFSVLLFIAPQEGMITKLWRRYYFQKRCQRENVIKALWKECDKRDATQLEQTMLQSILPIPPIRIKKMLRSLQKEGYLLIRKHVIIMTKSGLSYGQHLVRLHRLWELYLVEYCDIPKDRVHPSAEEMEHILSPEIEARLTSLLLYPTTDPHQQPIPPAIHE